MRHQKARVSLQRLVWDTVPAQRPPPALSMAVCSPSTSSQTPSPQGAFPNHDASPGSHFTILFYLWPFLFSEIMSFVHNLPLLGGIRSSTRGPSLPQDCVPGVLPVLHTAGAHEAREEWSRVGLPFRTLWFLTPPSSQRGLFLRDKNHLLSGVHKNNPRL